jgi:hypothetical protein
MKTLLFISLTLRDSHEELERSWLKAYAEVAKNVDGILLITPSIYEEPDAVHHQLVQDTLTACKLANLDVYWGRRSWVMWQSLITVPGFYQSPDDIFRPEYYAQLFGRINAEAKFINAKGSVIEAEPYGDCIFKEKLKVLTSEERQWMISAIGAAKRVGGGATMAYPASAYYKTNYPWITRLMGEEYLHHKTYNLIEAPPNVNPPNGVNISLHWWGSWLVPEQSTEPMPHPLTVEEWLAIDWDAIKAMYPELKGCWIYVEREKMLDVMYQLGEKGN